MRTKIPAHDKILAQSVLLRAKSLSLTPRFSEVKSVPSNEETVSTVFPLAARLRLKRDVNSKR
jgi:hypothetical protein